MSYDMRRGPFINEEGDVWVPVTVGGIGKAYKVAGEIGDRVRFVDMQDDVSMSLHEWAFSDPDEEEHREECEFKDQYPCTWTGRAYHFRQLYAF